MIRKIFIIVLGLLSILFTTETRSKRIDPKEDTYIQSNYPYTLVWNTRNLYTGVDFLYGKGSTESFFAFSDIYKDRKDRDILDSVKLNLYKYSGSEGDLSLCLIQDTNLELINWFSSRECQSTLKQFRSTFGHNSIDLTDLVKEKDNPVIKVVSTDSINSIFGAKECIVAPTYPKCSYEQMPYLEVSYTYNKPPSPPSFIESNIKSNLQNTTIRWTVSTDEENDSIRYKLKVSKEDESIELETELDSITIPTLEEGEYLVEIKSTDGLIDNYSYQSQMRVYTDHTPPSTPQIAIKPEFVSGETGKYYWTYNESDIDIDRFELEHLYSCKGNDETTDLEEVAESHIIYTNSWNNNLMCEGTHLVKVRACDTYNNCSNYTTTTSYYDSKSPVISLQDIDNIYLSDNEGFNEVPLNIDLLSDDINELKLTIYSLKNNSTTSRVISPTNTIYLTSQAKSDSSTSLYSSYQYFQAEDIYTVGIQAIDRAGNTSNSADIFVIKDITPPEVPIIDIPIPKITNNINSYIYITTLGEKNNSLIGNNKLIKDIESGVHRISLAELNAQEGNNSIQIIAYDNAGNVSKAYNSYNLDRIPPVAPNLSIQDTDSLKLNISNIEIGSKINAYLNEREIYSGFPSQNNIQLNLNLEPITGKAYTVKTYSKDIAGNISPMTSTTYSIPTEHRIGNSKDANAGTITEEIPMSTCKYKRNITKNTIIRLSCHFSSPRQKDIIHRERADRFEIESIYNYNKKLTYEVDTYRCAKRSVWKPETWFKCVEEYVKTDLASTNYYGYPKLNIDTESLESIGIMITDTDEHTTIYTPNNYTNKLASVAKKVLGTVHINGISYNVDEYSQPSNKLEIPKPKQLYPLTLPLNGTPSVSQWYGTTAYNPFHHGIDFAVYKEPIIAPADGQVVSKGWDSWGGDCNSGGNYIKLKHSNNIYTFYAHMQDYSSDKGRDIQVGDIVKRGERIGTTGNSGSSNCQPLGYHLHYEVREGPYQNNSTNPTSKTDADWSSIKTLTPHIYPGRLSGQNPHPTY